jgi:hypothetical protein
MSKNDNDRYQHSCPRLRTYLRWDHRHDAMAAKIIREFDLKLPADRELIRQLAFVRVQQGEKP